MTVKRKTNERICPEGHHFIKTSDCPVCPICATKNKPASGLLSHFAAPARRALQSKGITTLQQLIAFPKTEISQLHGIGPSAISTINALLKKEGLHWK